jgi:ubiquitin carboxyl-terminal hydrolase 14
VTHKGAAADSGHYIGFVKKSVFYEARAKAKASNTALDQDINTALEEFRREHLSDSSGNVAPLSDSALVSILGGAVGPAAAVPSESASATMDQDQGNNGPTDSNLAPVSTSVAVLETEEDEDWYKFDDDKVSDFPKEKLPTLEGGGEDSSAYVLVYRSKVL